MSHFHQGAEVVLGLAVGLWLIDFGEFLDDTVAFTSLNEGILVGAHVLLAVIGVGVVDLVRALGNYAAGQELGGTVLGLVRQEVIDGDEQVLPKLIGG